MKVCIFPQMKTVDSFRVCIVGDQDGLRHLATLISKMAEIDVQSLSIPEGAREHIHISSGEEGLGWHSCEIEICRAEAKGTGELPEYMED